MSMAPEAIEVGKCYLTGDGRVRRVTDILPSGEVRYRYRSFPAAKRRAWRSGSLRLDVFAATLVREVPCNWTPERDEP